MTKSAPRNRRPATRRLRHDHGLSSDTQWIWGTHAALAALANPDREIERVLATPNALARLGDHARRSPVDTVDGEALARALPPGAVHQGIAVRVKPLEALAIEELIAADPARVAVLDQVTDPHNLGAIWRSAAAFGLGGLILQNRHTPAPGGVVAKAAAGALETVAESRVVNIARAVETLQSAGYHVVGLAGDTEREFCDAVRGAERLALVLGAEGAGLRPNVARACSELARIPIAAAMASLNVSNAAAIAFYEAARG
jgi:23S rRNA (guanosine2251-2'-O)-methyltransferase